MRKPLALVLSTLAVACGEAGGPSAPPARDAAPPGQDAARHDGGAPEAPGTPRRLPGVLPGLVLGVWGGDDGPWFAGGGPDVDGGFLLRLDGDRVAPVATPPGATLWWVWGDGAGTLYACGEEGRVVARRGGRWSTDATGLPAAAVLYGVWGAGADDLWAVGGSPRPGGPKGLVLRSAGDGVWTRLEDPALPDDLDVFKVWGAAADDVHLVGEAGLALHWDGARLRRLETPTRERLFTVHGRSGGPVYAVGGTSTGVVLRLEGDRWVDDGVAGLPPLNGVYVRPDGGVVVSGARGAAAVRAPDGAWTRTPLADLDPARDTLHAVWAERDVWMVGGDFVRAEYGVVVSDRDPAPRLDWAPPAVPDAGADAAPPADAAPRDAAPDDGGPLDAGVDAEVDAAPRDGGPFDAGPGDAADLDATGRDAAEPDAVVDAEVDAVVDAVVDAEVDAALPGPGEDCLGFACGGTLECWGVAQADYRNICTRPCRDVAECADFGEACCQVPGPQLARTFCVPRALLPDGCAQ